MTDECNFDPRPLNCVGSINDINNNQKETIKMYENYKYLDEGGNLNMDHFETVGSTDDGVIILRTEKGYLASSLTIVDLLRQGVEI